MSIHVSHGQDDNMIPEWRNRHVLKIDTLFKLFRAQWHHEGFSVLYAPGETAIYGVASNRETALAWTRRRHLSWFLCGGTERIDKDC